MTIRISKTIGSLATRHFQTIFHMKFTSISASQASIWPGAIAESETPSLVLRSVPQEMACKKWRNEKMIIINIYIYIIIYILYVYFIYIYCDWPIVCNSSTVYTTKNCTKKTPLFYLSGWKCTGPFVFCIFLCCICTRPARDAKLSC